jgi:hypothetical protein
MAVVKPLVLDASNQVREAIAGDTLNVDITGLTGGGAAPTVYYNAVGGTLDAVRIEVQAQLAALVSGQTLIVRMKSNTDIGGGSSGPGVVQQVPCFFTAADCKIGVSIVYEGGRAEGLVQGTKYFRDQVLIKPSATGSWGIYTEGQGIGACDFTGNFADSSSYAVRDADIGVTGTPASGSLTRKVMFSKQFTSYYGDLVIGGRFQVGNSYWDQPANISHAWKMNNATLQTANAGYKGASTYFRYYSTSPVSNTSGPMITLTNCNDITFRFFRFQDIHPAIPDHVGDEYGNISVPASTVPTSCLNMIGCSNIKIDQCKVVDCNGHAFVYDYQCVNLSISKSIGLRIGFCFSFLSKINSTVQTQDRVTLTDNTIEEPGYFSLGAAGIVLYNTSNSEVVDNRVIRGPACGIAIGDQGGFSNGQVGNKIIRNKLIGLSQINEDTAPIKTLAIIPGLEISDNEITIPMPWKGVAAGSGAFTLPKCSAPGAIYLDNKTQGTSENPIVVSNNKVNNLLGLRSDYSNQQATNANIIWKQDGYYSDEVGNAVPKIDYIITYGNIDVDSVVTQDLRVVPGPTTKKLLQKKVTLTYVAGKVVFELIHGLSRRPSSIACYATQAIGQFSTGEKVEPLIYADSSVIRITFLGSFADLVGVGTGTASVPSTPGAAGVTLPGLSVGQGNPGTAGTIGSAIEVVYS